MAKLKRILDAAEYATLSPAQKDFYVNRDGRYFLDADDAEALTNALERTREEKKALEARVAGYGDLTPEQAKELMKQTEKAQREKDFAAGNFEKILSDERSKYAKDLEIRDGNEQRLRGALAQALIDAEATREIVAQGGNPALLLPIIKQRAKLQTVGEAETAVIMSDKGVPLLKSGAKGAEDFMGIGEYVGVLKSDKQYAGAFASKAGSGSGGQRYLQQPAPGTAQRAEFDAVLTQVKSGATVLAP